MKFLSKEIEEVEKGCGKFFRNEAGKLNGYKVMCGTEAKKYIGNLRWERGICPKCQAKLQALKLAQEKHDNFVEKLKKKVLLNWKGQNKFVDYLDKLSEETQ